MPEKEIRALLKKYLEGRATPEDEKLIDEWYDSLSATDRESLSDAERAKLRNSYWSAIRSDMHTQTAKTRDMWPRVLGIAASVSVVLMLMFYVMSPRAVERVMQAVSPHQGIEPIENRSSEIMIALLPDSSRVELFPDSEIFFDEDFGSVDRKVRLTGEAFFEISHDAERPFYVFTGEVVTRVLGTSFRVIAYPDADEITVAVSTGKVSVYTRADADRPFSEEDKIVLTPNQQAVYSRGEQTVSRTLAKEPKPLISDAGSTSVRFEGAPVTDVFTALEKVYQVDIEFDSAVFAECSITTSITGEDMFERIDVICEIIGASYEVVGTTILISGPGCN